MKTVRATSSTATAKAVRMKPAETTVAVQAPPTAPAVVGTMRGSTAFQGMALPF